MVNKRITRIFVVLTYHLYGSIDFLGDNHLNRSRSHLVTVGELKFYASLECSGSMRSEREVEVNIRVCGDSIVAVCRSSKFYCLYLLDNLVAEVQTCSIAAGSLSLSLYVAYGSRCCQRTVHLTSLSNLACYDSYVVSHLYSLVPIDIVDKDRALVVTIGKHLEGNIPLTCGDIVNSELLEHLIIFRSSLVGEQVCLVLGC